MLVSSPEPGKTAFFVKILLAMRDSLHDLDRYQYYLEITKAVPHCKKAEDYEALLPWNIDLVKVTTKDQQLTLFHNLNYDAYNHPYQIILHLQWYEDKDCLLKIQF